MKRSTSPNMFAYVRPWIWLSSRCSVEVRKSRRSTFDRPSGRNRFVKIELSTANHVAIDLPTDALRYLDTFGVAGGISLRLHDGWHGKHCIAPWRWM